LIEPLLIRADGGATIGLGHLVRSLALAEAWSHLGGAVAAVTASPRASPLSRAGVAVHAITAAYPDPGDAAATIATALAVGARWVVCDGYAFDGGYVDALHAVGLRVLQIDDGQAALDSSADVLLNQNIGAETMAYHVRPAARLLLGTRFALLRDSILRSARPRDARAAPRRVVLLSGGSDVASLAPRSIRAFRAVAGPAIGCDVIIGQETTPATVVEAAAGDTRIAIHHDPLDPGRLMAAADVAVTAAGSTCWELCYIGVPMIAVSVAGNQLPIASGLHAAGAAVDLGPHQSVSDAALATALQRLLGDATKRTELAAHGQSLVDGRGRERVVATLRGEEVP